MPDIMPVQPTHLQYGSAGWNDLTEEEKARRTQELIKKVQQELRDSSARIAEMQKTTAEALKRAKKAKAERGGPAIMDFGDAAVPGRNDLMPLNDIPMSPEMEARIAKRESDKIASEALWGSQVPSGPGLALQQPTGEPAMDLFGNQINPSMTPAGRLAEYQRAQTANPQFQAYVQANKDVMDAARQGEVIGSPGPLYGDPSAAVTAMESFNSPENVAKRQAYKQRLADRLATLQQHRAAEAEGLSIPEYQYKELARQAMTVANEKQQQINAAMAEIMKRGPQTPAEYIMAAAYFGADEAAKAGMAEPGNVATASLPGFWAGSQTSDRPASAIDSLISKITPTGASGAPVNENPTLLGPTAKAEAIKNAKEKHPDDPDSQSKEMQQAGIGRIEADQIAGVNEAPPTSGNFWGRGGWYDRFTQRQMPWTRGIGSMIGRTFFAPNPPGEATLPDIPMTQYIQNLEHRASRGDMDAWRELSEIRAGIRPAQQ